MDKENQIIELISGNIKEKDKMKILQEIENDISLQNKYEKVKNAWSLSFHNQEIDNIIIEKSWVRFRTQLKTKGKYRMLNLLKYAAIILFVFTLGLVSQKHLLPDTASLTQNDLNEIHVPNGEQAELILSDGSKVWLNSGTTLKFPGSFTPKERKVSIDGEAYFEVQKDKVPFIVSSKSGDIKVLGTAFNIRAYKNMQFKTTLVEGSIQFNNSSNKALLEPGQQLSINSNGNFEIEEVDGLQVSSWKKGIISFHSEPLQEVFKKLERHYDIKINAPSNLASIRFTGQIIDESLDEIMILIDRTKPINYHYERKLKILKITEKNR